MKSVQVTQVNGGFIIQYSNGGRPETAVVTSASAVVQFVNELFNPAPVENENDAPF